MFSHLAVPERRAGPPEGPISGKRFDLRMRERAIEAADARSAEFIEWLLDCGGEDWYDAFVKASCAAAAQDEDGAYQLMKAWSAVQERWAAACERSTRWIERVTDELTQELAPNVEPSDEC